MGCQFLTGLLPLHSILFTFPNSLQATIYKYMYIPGYREIVRGNVSCPRKQHMMQKTSLQATNLPLFNQKSDEKYDLLKDLNTKLPDISLTCINLSSQQSLFCYLTACIIILQQFKECPEESSPSLEFTSKYVFRNQILWKFN